MHDDVLSQLSDLELRVAKELSVKGSRSYDEVAEACNISVRHLYRLRQQPNVKAAVRKIVMDELETELPSILNSLTNKAKKGDFRSQELIIKMLGGVVTRSEVKQTTTIENAQTVSDEDLKRELDELKALINETQSADNYFPL